jgi:hypothetical protein
VLSESERKSLVLLRFKARCCLLRNNAATSSPEAAAASFTNKDGDDDDEALNGMLATLVAPTIFDLSQWARDARRRDLADRMCVVGEQKIVGGSPVDYGMLGAFLCERLHHAPSRAAQLELLSSVHHIHLPASIAERNLNRSDFFAGATTGGEGGEDCQRQENSLSEAGGGEDDLLSRCWWCEDDLHHFFTVAWNNARHHHVFECHAVAEQFASIALGILPNVARYRDRKGEFESQYAAMVAKSGQIQA